MISFGNRAQILRKPLAALMMIMPLITLYSISAPELIAAEKTEKAAIASTCPTIKTHPFNLQKQADGIYVRKGRHQIFTKDNFAAIANISIVIGENSVAVIDTGGSYCDGKRFRQAIKQVTNKPISHVINTHVHPDHTLGNQVFNEEGVIFIGHKNLKRAMAEKGAIYITNLKRIMGEAAMKGTKIVPPTEFVETTKTIDLGNRELILQAHKTAHTNQDLTVFDEKTKTLWTGDLLFHEHTPVVDGSLLGWLKRMDELAKIPATHVVPGHGGPFLEWPDGLKPQRQYLDILTKDLRTIIEEGGTMLEAQTKAGISEKPNWKLFEEFNARNASTGFAELEWE